MTEDEKRMQSPYAVDAESLYSRFASDKPTYAGTYEKPLAETYAQIAGRPAFSYDVSKDPLYQQYKDRYMQLGKSAMKDTMGQAAALTGGYGSTYGQGVGQQSYDAYLQRLNDVVPELYSQAYGRYQDEGDRLLQRYSLLGQQRDTEYQRYQDALGQWQNERAYQTQLENEEYGRKQTEYSRLYSMIMSMGYQPSAEELAAAGMSEKVASALLAQYQAANAPAAAPAAVYYGGGSGSSSGSGSLSGKIANNISKNGANTSSKPTRGDVDRAAREAYQNGEITYKEYRTILSGIH